MNRDIDTGTRLPLVEEFYSIQGEGFHSGNAAYFIRLGGCDVGCRWCDSRFTWDPELHDMVETSLIISNVVRSGADSVVVTGGEPLMWNLGFLTSELKRNNICSYLETSGTYPLSGEWDWICLSPKEPMPPVKDIYMRADELKVIVEKPADLAWAEKNRELVSMNCRLFLQPEWSKFNTIIPEIVEYIKKHTYWRISLQVHKYMHIP